MEASFFLNNVALFYASAILERRAATQTRKRRAEHTSVSMPPALIEGTESIVAFTLMILAPSRWHSPLFAGFALLVVVSTCQRVYWAWTVFR